MHYAQRIGNLRRQPACGAVTTCTASQGNRQAGAIPTGELAQQTVSSPSYSLCEIGVKWKSFHSGPDDSEHEPSHIRIRAVESLWETEIAGPFGARRVERPLPRINPMAFLPAASLAVT